MKDLDVFKLRCHPAAEKFPMLDRDELAELANDISENGLHQPLVVCEYQGETVLLDGRNRRAACELVKVTPDCVEFDGDDPAAFVLSSNINRRHMTKGQRAMAVAMVYPEPANVRRRGSGLSETEGLSGTRVSMARTVLAWRPEIADQVLAGSTPLDQAYKEARDAKLAADSYEQRFARLKDAAPDLAEQVTEGRLSFGEATAALDARNKQLRAERLAVAQNITNWRLFASSTSTEKHLDLVAQVLRDAPEIFKEASGLTPAEYVESLAAIRDRASAIIKRVSA